MLPEDQINQPTSINSTSSCAASRTLNKHQHRHESTRASRQRPMKKPIRSDREIAEAGERDAHIKLRQDIKKRSLPVVNVPIPWTITHLKLLCLIHRTKFIGVLVWIFYPLLLLVGLAWWKTFGLITLTMITLCSIAILFSKGPWKAKQFLRESIAEYAPGA